MTDTVFPTGLSHLGSVSTSFEVFADNGAANGWIAVSDIIGLVPTDTTRAPLSLASIALASPTTLSFATHHLHTLYTTGSMTLTVPSAATLTDGFSTCVKTNPGQTVTLVGTLYDLTGNTVTSIPPSSEAKIGVWGAVVYIGVYSAIISNPTPRIVTASPATVASADGLIVCNRSTSGTMAISLEASPVAGVTHVIKDGKGDAATNPITITPASGTIDGASSFVLSVNRAAVTVTYTGTEWSVI